MSGARFNQYGSCIEHGAYNCSLCTSRDYKDEQAQADAHRQIDTQRRIANALERLVLLLEKAEKR